MVSLTAVVYCIVYLVVAGLIFWLLHYLIGAVGLPEPFARVAHVILIVAAVLIVIFLLLSLATGQPLFRP